MAALIPVFLQTNNKEGEGRGLGWKRPVETRSNAMNSSTGRGPRGDRERQPNPRPEPVPGSYPRRKSTASIQVYNVPYAPCSPANGQQGGRGAGARMEAPCRGAVQRHEFVYRPWTAGRPGAPAEPPPRARARFIPPTQKHGKYTSLQRPLCSPRFFLSEAKVKVSSIVTLLQNRYWRSAQDSFRKRARTLRNTSAGTARGYKRAEDRSPTHPRW